MASNPIYQFYAELYDYEPKMWRRFQVANNVNMAKLGYILMTMFEMKASHLFCFDVPYNENLKMEMTRSFAEKNLGNLLEDEFSSLNKKNDNWHIEIITEYSYESIDEENEKLINATDKNVKHIISSPDERMTFSYDFGDNWQVNIVLEKVIEDKELPGKELPRVLEGEGYGIIEDCGGVGGLEDIAKAFKNKKGKQYEEYCEWLGVDNLDLFTFDIDDMNFRLKKVPRIYANIYEFELEPTKQSFDLLERKYKKNT